MKKPIKACKQKTPKEVNVGTILGKYRLCIYRPADVGKKQAHSILFDLSLL